jgi:hypothetical protein
MKRYRGLFFVFMFLLILFPAFSQTPAEIERMLDEPAITYRQAAWFTLAVALDLPDGNEQYVSEFAFAMARDKGWLYKNAEGETPITMAGLSYLMMKVFDIKGGLMYRLAKNPRYAYRELKSLGYISGDVYSNQKVSGEQFLRILENVSGGGSGET